MGDGAGLKGGSKGERPAKKRLSRADRILAGLIFTILGVGGLAAAGLVTAVFMVLRDLPEHDPFKMVDEPAIIYVGAEGVPFARYGTLVEEPVEAGELPGHVVKALLAVEDRRFQHHLGVDLRGILRAARENHEAGRVVQGGSTLTQQLARNLYLTNERTSTRKIKEALVALGLEATHSKDEIVGLYLSNVYFGDGVYGLRAAARHYFDKQPAELTLGEGALLMGLLKAPSDLTPNRRPEQASARARIVLATMVDAGFISPEEADIEIPFAYGRRAGLPMGSYFSDWHAATTPRVAEERYGDIVVETTLRADFQSVGERVITDMIAAEGEAKGFSQAALVAMRKDGEVLAMAGGSGYAMSQFNRATQARRQPGSAFKLFVYLAGLRAGLTPDSGVTDQPVAIGDWEPKNFDDRFHGRMSVREAFARSINSVPVQISAALGHEEMIHVARAFGARARWEAVPSLSLGAGDMTLLELTAAYAAIPSAAYPIRPYGVDAERGVEPLKAFDEAAPMDELLGAVVSSGTGRAARLDVRAAGKTGTSQEYRDAWFIGYAGDVVLGIWVGNDDFSPMRRVTGGDVPARMWKAFMTEALRLPDEPNVPLAVLPRPRPQIDEVPIVTGSIGAAE